MSKTDDAYNRVANFESRLKHTRGSFVSALHVGYGGTDGSDPDFIVAVDALCADLRCLMVAVEDAEDYRERLHDLVSLDSEEAAIGGGPGFKDRRARAWTRAYEPFEP